MKSKCNGLESNANKSKIAELFTGGDKYISPSVTILSLYQQDVLTESNEFDIEWGEEWN